MRALCTANSPNALGNETLKAAYSRNVHLEEVWLRVGQEYDVYGVCFRDGDGVPWFLIAEEEDDDYPKPHLAAFFRVVDPRIPSGWSYSGPNNVGDVSMLPDRWAKDPSFLEKMVDEVPEAVAYFAELKKLSQMGRDPADS